MTHFLCHEGCGKNTNRKNLRTNLKQFKLENNLKTTRDSTPLWSWLWLYTQIDSLHISHMYHCYHNFFYPDMYKSERSDFFQKNVVKEFYLTLSQGNTCAADRMLKIPFFIQSHCAQCVDIKDIIAIILHREMMWRIEIWGMLTMLISDRGKQPGQQSYGSYCRIWS